MISTDIGIWIGALLTLFVYSYFVRSKQNIFFRFAQSTIVGCALGYTISIVMIKNIDYLGISKIIGGQVLYIIPILLGLLVYARFVPGYTYLTRTPIAFIVTVGIVLGARGAMESQLFTVMLSSVNWLVFGTDVVTSLNNLILIIGLISGITYFFFTMKGKGIPGYNQFWLMGRYFLMVYFGTRYGMTILSRLSLLIGRLQYLLFNWLGLR
jgi:hypothetical protein